MQNKYIDFLNRLTDEELAELKAAIEIVENAKKLNATGCEARKDNEGDYPMYNDGSSIY